MTTKDKDIVPALTKQVAPIVLQATELEIIDAASMTQATEMLSVLNKKNDQITDEKEKITKPLNQALKVERSRWKPLETTLEEAIGIVRRKMSAYQTEAKRIADIEAAKIAARVGEGRGKLTPETAVRKLGEIDAPAATVASDAGSVAFRTVKHFEVMDFSALPDNYKLADESAIRTAMKQGVEVPGVRYYETQEPVNSR